MPAVMSLGGGIDIQVNIKIEMSEILRMFGQLF